jgi:putative copper resistance protein D
MGKSARSMAVPAGAALALATLAWTGHAAATEGAAGLVHRAADIVHLLAAGAWIGALAALVALLFVPEDRDEDIATAEQALAAFAGAGSVIVALIVVSGTINSWMIVGVGGLATLPSTLYGQLLIAKLALFVAMLGHAAVNRWRLTPALERARAAGEAALAVRAIRISVVSELAAAATILALVAWLGTLEPGVVP